MFNLKSKKKNDGFTLLELLIVIAIIAILSVILVIVLNPSESLKKTRDSQRMSDLATLKKAIGLYVTMTPYPKLAGLDNTGCKGTTMDANTWQTSTDKIYYSYPSDAPGAPITATALDGVTFAAPGGVNQVLKANLGLTNGSGWIPIDFSTITGGSPISALPVDPINTIVDKASPKSTDLVYRYICSEKNLTYEISATLESSAYTVADNKMAKDGGNADGYFEAGTGLSLFTSDYVPPVLVVGDSYGGGKIAYILQVGDPGYSATVQHGLIVANSITGTVEWGCNGTAISGADGTALGTGYQNTLDIMAGCATAGIVARAARAYTNGGYSDWYLPSKDELYKIYLNRTILGITSNGYFWSSSESDASNAWGLGWTFGLQETGPKWYTRPGLPIRSF